MIYFNLKEAPVASLFPRFTKIHQKPVSQMHDALSLDGNM